MYLFVRLECGTYWDGECIYSFTPETDSGWSRVDGVGEDRQIFLAYTENNILKSMEATDTVDFSGKLTCVIPVREFMELADDDMVVDFKGFGIDTSVSPNPKVAYEANLANK